MHTPLDASHAGQAVLLKSALRQAGPKRRGHIAFTDAVDVVPVAGLKGEQLWWRPDELSGPPKKRPRIAKRTSLWADASTTERPPPSPTDCHGPADHPAGCLPGGCDAESCLSKSGTGSLSQKGDGPAEPESSGGALAENASGKVRAELGRGHGGGPAGQEQT